MGIGYFLYFICWYWQYFYVFTDIWGKLFLYISVDVSGLESLEDWKDSQLFSIILSNNEKHNTVMVSCSRFVWITISRYHRRIWTAYVFDIKQLPNPKDLMAYFVCKRFAVQTFLWSMKFGIQTNLDYDTITVWNLSRSWSISKT